MTRKKQPHDYIDDGLKAIGFDSSLKEDTVATPQRWARAIQEFCKGDPDVEAIVKNGFEPAHDPGLIVQSNIPFRMLCEHHLFPAFGRAYVGYIPHEHMVGLSKLSRIVDAFGTSHPGTQEIITEQIGVALQKVLGSHGVAVMIRATHSCMEVRGARSPGIVTTSSYMSGLLLTVPSAKEEFMRLALL